MRKKIAEILMIILLIPTYSVMGDSGVPIPGIDDLPGARGNPPEMIPLTETEGEKKDASPDDQADAQTDEKDYTETEQPVSEGEGLAQDQSSSDGLPVVKMIQVKIEEEFPRSIRITWKTNPDNDTAIYVTRYSRPISSSTRLFNAYNITSPPLGPGENYFIDRDIPEGTYYYAVVSSFELTEKEKLKLVSEQNYTSEPVVIYKDSDKPVIGYKQEPADQPRSVDESLKELLGRDKQENREFEVRYLTAVNSKDSVKLSWSLPGTVRGVKYRVYRNSTGFEKPSDFDEAEQIGTASEKESRFQDSSPIENRPVFYAVTVVDQSTGKENRELTADRSFISHQFEPAMEVSSENEDLIQKDLISFLSAADEVRLRWTAVGDQIEKFQIYRSSEPIFGESRLKDAKRIGFTDQNTTEFVDSDPMPGPNYYAVFPEGKDGKENRIFVEGRTFTGFAIQIEDRAGAIATDSEEEEDYQIDGIRAVNLEDSVKLTWQKANAKDIYYTVYRVPRGKDSGGLQRIGFVRGGQATFVDQSPVPGKEMIYFVSTTDEKSGQEIKIVEFGKTFVIHTFPGNLAEAGANTEKTEPEKKGPEEQDLLPGAFLAYTEKEGNRLVWTDPEADSLADYSIYRSDQPIDGPSELNAAKRLAIVGKGKEEYLDRNLTSAGSYYALIPRDQSAKRYEKFVEGKTFTGSPVVNTFFQEKKAEQKGSETPETDLSKQTQIAYFNAGYDGQDIKFSWGVKQARDGNVSGVKLLLYKSDHALLSLRDVRDYGFLVGEFEEDSTGTTEKAPRPGFYYYALVIEQENTVVTEAFVEGKNYLSGPIFVRRSATDNPQIAWEPNTAPEKKHTEITRKAEQLFEQPLDRVNAVIAETYMKKQFHRAVESLKVYTDDASLDATVRARAMFYMGLSYYSLGEYRKALVIFMTEGVQNEYPERANFWYKRSLEMLR